MSFFNTRRRASVACALVLALAAATAVRADESATASRTLRNFYNHALDDAHRGHVDESSSDFFDYSKEYFDANFSYTFTDGEGLSRTVPITTPATNPAMMKALLREVWTNRDIPGRRWIRNTAPGLDDYINYTVGENDPRTALIGIAPGDYTPRVDGLTCLLVEGYDTDLDRDELSKADFETLLFNQIKSIRLLTNRMYLDDNPGAGPGYIFNVSQQMRKFFVISKGKARDVHIAADADNEHVFAPMMMLYEEFSANESTDRNPKDVYKDLMGGEPLKITHDCTSTIMNNHWMRVVNAESGAVTRQDISFFIPDLRSFDDIDGIPVGADGKPVFPAYDLYTWYHPDHLPFAYRYTVRLEATAEVADPSELDGLDDLLGGREDDVDPDLVREHWYWVTLDWLSNFRSRFFDTASKEETYIYRVVDGVRQTTPLAVIRADKNGSLTGNDDAGRMICIYPDGTIVNNSAEINRVYVLEPQYTDGRSLSYVCSSRPVDMAAAEAVFSNIADVYIPGYTPNEHMTLNISGNELSTFKPGCTRNHYENTLLLKNRSDREAITALDFPSVADVNQGRFTAIALERIPVYDDGTAGDAVKLAEVVFDRSYQGSTHCYFTGTITHFNEDGSVDTDRIVDYTPGVDNDFNTLRFRAAGLREAGAPIENLYPPFDDKSELLVFSDLFQADLVAANSHAARYLYRARFTTPEGEHYRSNTERIDVYKSDVEIGLKTYTEDEILSDDDAALSFEDSNVTLTVQNLPYIEYYRLVYHDAEDDDAESVIAELGLDKDYFSVSLRSAEPVRHIVIDEDGNKVYVESTVLEPWGEPVAVVPGGKTAVTLPLRPAQVYGPDGNLREFVVQIGVRPSTSASETYSVDTKGLNTYGTAPRQTSPLPMLDISAQMDAVDDSDDFNRRTTAVVVADWSELQGYDVEGVHHYKIWESLGDADDLRLIHDASLTLPYSDENGWYSAEYDNDEDNSVLVFSSAHLDEEPSTPSKAGYLVRAYLTLKPKAGPAAASGRRRAPAADVPVYAIAETRTSVNFMGGNTTGMDDVLDGHDAANVTAVADGVLIETAGAEHVEVFDVKGRGHFSGKVEGRRHIALLPGFYIVKAGTVTAKIVI